MAKQAVGPAIRYLDKAVLGLCGIIFLYFVAMYGVMSPNKAADDGGEQYGPGQIDGLIHDDAERLRERLINADPPPTPTPSPMPDLNVLDNVLALAKVTTRIPSPVPPGPTVPEDESDGIGTAQPTVDLVGVIALGTPQVRVGRSGVYLAPPTDFKVGDVAAGRAEAAYLQDTNWVTVYAPFDRARQESLFLAANHGRYAQAVVLGVDLERRMQEPGGGWSAWAAVNATRTMNEPTVAPPLVEPGEKGVHEVREDDRKAVDEFYTLITAGDNKEAQCELLRPLFPTIAYGDDWTFPRPEGLDVLMMDSDFQETPRCRYPECVVAAEQIDGAAKSEELYKKAEAALKEEKFDTARKYAEAARDAAVRDKAERDEKKATALLERIAIEEAKARQEMTNKKKSQPIQLVWAHDAGAGSLRSGRTYAYRARIRLYNMFCARPTLLNKPLEASTVELVGEWSAPSDPVVINPDTLIFLKSEKANAQEVKVEVFKWFAGQWLMRQFTVTIGDAIGEVKTMATPPTGEKLPVDFRTGGTVVDRDFRHKALIPVRKSRTLQSVETTALIYVDASGNLRQQLLEFDKTSQRYDELRRLLWKEP